MTDECSALCEFSHAFVLLAVEIKIIAAGDVSRISLCILLVFGG